MIIESGEDNVSASESTETVSENGQTEDDDRPAGTLFRDSEIEKAEKKTKEEKKRDSILNILWRNARKKAEKAAEKTGKLLDELCEEDINK